MELSLYEDRVKMRKNTSKVSPRPDAHGQICPLFKNEHMAQCFALRPYSVICRICKAMKTDYKKAFTKQTLKLYRLENGGYSYNFLNVECRHARHEMAMQRPK